MHETRKGLPSQIWWITHGARPYSSRRSLLVNGKADLGLHTFSAVPLHRSTQARYNQFQGITGKRRRKNLKKVPFIHNRTTHKKTVFFFQLVNRLVYKQISLLLFTVVLHSEWFSFAKPVASSSITGKTRISALTFSVLL